MNNNIPHAIQFCNTKNQILILEQSRAILQSYSSTIATIEKTDDKYIITIFKMWNYSNTTLKHFYLFLKEFAKDFYSLYLENSTDKATALKEQFNKSHLIKTGDNINIYEVREG
jgi:hypothetical protein